MSEAQRLSTLIARHGDAFRAQGIDGLYLFGSRSRDEHRLDSDVDLFCDIDPSRRLSLFDLMDIETALAGIIDAKVDLISREGLHPVIAAEVQSQAIRLL